MFKNNLTIWFLFTCFILQSCSESVNKSISTPTSGFTTIAVDETFYPIIKAEKEVFESIYELAKINLLVLPEREAFQALEKGQVDLIISARTLTEKQQLFFSQKKIFPRQTAIADDGIAVILNKENLDTCFTTETLKKIITGEIKKWTDINSKSKLDAIKILFDNPNSSTVRFMLDSIGNGEKILQTMSAMKTNKEVINFVSKEKNAIGFIGVNWVSDHDDTTAMSFLKDIRVAYISSDGKQYVQPYQAFMATRKYPVLRRIYTICTEPNTGLATGFVSFLASERGQRIILKSGILPITAPIRLIQVKDDF